MAIDLFPVISLVEGEEGIVHSILGGRGLIIRLAAMGIAPGIRIKILRNSGGPVVILTSGTRVAIGRGQASRIMIIKSHAPRYGKGEIG